MSRLLMSAALLTLGFAAQVGAQTQNAPAGDSSPTTQKASTANHSPIKPGDRNCLHDTGSLIPAKKGECLPVTGRTYSKSDIDATGAHTLGPALRDLDPAITLHGNSAGN